MSWLYWLVLALALVLLLTPWLAHFPPNATYTLWLFSSVLLVAVVIWSVLAVIGQRIKITGNCPRR